MRPFYNTTTNKSVSTKTAPTPIRVVAFLAMLLRNLRQTTEIAVPVVMQSAAVHARAPRRPTPHAPGFSPSQPRSR
jgi:hypothetical protein